MVLWSLNYPIIMNTYLEFILFIFLQFISIRIIYSGVKTIFKFKNDKNNSSITWQSFIFPSLIVLGGISFSIWHFYSFLK